MLMSSNISRFIVSDFRLCFKCQNDCLLILHNHIANKYKYTIVELAV